MWMAVHGRPAAFRWELLTEKRLPGTGIKEGHS